MALADNFTQVTVDLDGLIEVHGRKGELLVAMQQRF